MSDPARSNDPRATDPADDRDARVEQLLLGGLDHYFAGRYEQAIHVWTRVLFVDRGHPRARAYIERARAAIAERQRQSEELLHRGTAAFERGQADAARSLLTAAVEQGAPPEVALGYLERLDRLGGPQRSQPSRLLRRPGTVRREGARARRRSAIVWMALAAVIVVGIVSYVGTIADLIAPSGARRAAPAPLRDEALPIPRPSELDLARAHRLFATGHAADALRVLERIAPMDPNRPEADRLRADIQRTLLATLGPEDAAQPGRPASR
ncbi:MAG TPA: hypothetical protein VIL25_02465 [Vicinamibacterales bacterium]